MGLAYFGGVLHRSSQMNAKPGRVLAKKKARLRPFWASASEGGAAGTTTGQFDTI